MLVFPNHKNIEWERKLLDTPALFCYTLEQRQDNIVITGETYFISIVFWWICKKSNDMTKWQEKYLFTHLEEFLQTEIRLVSNAGTETIKLKEMKGYYF